jgi:RimJ/RimL family protein N-acetyltransferase
MAVPPLSDSVVRLREWDLADAQWYAATAAHDELIQQFTSESPTLTVEQVRAAIAELHGNTDLAGFLICDAVGGERLGNIALSHADGIGHVSYWLAAAARGRGAATRALRLLSDWAFESLALDELRLWTHVQNTASRQVAERVGYLRHPELDQPRQVKAATWQTSAYRLPAPARR